jgi:hypothetical protein
MTLGHAPRIRKGETVKNPLRSLLLTACFAVVIGCGGGITGMMPSGFDELVSQGWDLYNQSEYDQAFRLFDQAVKTDAVRPEGYIGTGWSLLRRQHPDSAAVAFKIGFSYITTASDSVDAICGLAGSYLASGNNNKVVTILNDYPVSDIEKEFPLKHHDFLLESGDLEIVQAMAFYRLGLYSSAERADPDNAVYHLNRVLAIPYTYSSPDDLLNTIIEYLDSRGGGSFP